MILQQEKNTESLDNLFAVKNWSCILLTWSASNTNELCHPKTEKCLHHPAELLKQELASKKQHKWMLRSHISKGALNMHTNIANVRLKWNDKSLTRHKYINENLFYKWWLHPILKAAPSKGGWRWLAYFLSLQMMQLSNQSLIFSYP